MGNALIVEAAAVVDGTSPRLSEVVLDPQRVVPGGIVRIAATFDEPLGAAPTLLGVETLGAPIIIAERIVTWLATAPPIEDEIAVSIADVTDTIGNVAESLPLGTFMVDGTAPRIVEGSVTVTDGDGVVVGDRVLSAADTLRVQFNADEPLLASATVEVAVCGRSLVRDDGGVYTVALAGAEVSATCATEATLTDEVGNRATRVVAVVVIDAVAPSLGSADSAFVTPTTVEAGGFSLLTVVFSEPFAAPPTLVWDVDPGFFFDGALSSELVATYRLDVTLGAPAVGQYDLQAIDVVDVVGNAVRLPVPRTITVNSDVCAAGLQDGGGGACLPEGACAPGLHNGGSGVCVPRDTCSATFHDGGVGVCVPVGSCAQGFTDGGDGSCVRLGTCARGLISIRGICRAPTFEALGTFVGNTPIEVEFPSNAGVIVTFEVFAIGAWRGRVEFEPVPPFEEFDDGMDGQWGDTFFTTTFATEAGRTQAFPELSGLDPGNPPLTGAIELDPPGFPAPTAVFAVEVAASPTRLATFSAALRGAGLFSSGGVIRDLRFFAVPAECGDGVCRGTDEYCTSCVADCRPCGCGDGVCGEGEGLANCSEDCFCGDGSCDLGVEDAGGPQRCPQDCCGDGVCSPSEDSGQFPLVCIDDCSVCGDAFCGTREGNATCPDDCHVCGDGTCALEEFDFSLCEEDCGFSGDGVCSSFELDFGSCPADCEP